MRALIQPVSIGRRPENLRLRRGSRIAGAGVVMPATSSASVLGLLLSACFCACPRASAEPHSRDPARTDPLPALTAGVELGPAIAYCDHCDSTTGLGARGVVLFPVGRVFAMGLLTEYDTFPYLADSHSAFALVAPLVALSSGYGRRAHVEMWMALGKAWSTVDGRSDPSLGQPGLQLGLRGSTKVSSRIRASLSGSIGGAPTSRFSDGVTADRTTSLNGATLVALGLAYDLVTSD